MISLRRGPSVRASGGGSLSAPAFQMDWGLIRAGAFEEPLLRWVCLPRHQIANAAGASAWSFPSISVPASTSLAEGLDAPQQVLKASLFPVVSVVDDHLTIEVKKSPSPNDLLFLVQSSVDLTPSSWTSFNTEVLDEDGTHLLARCKKSITQQPRCHLRIKVVVQ